MLVNEQTTGFRGDQVQRQLELRAAIASQAVKDVAGEALGMDADQRRRTRRGSQIAHLQDYGFLGVLSEAALEPEDPKLSIAGWELGFSHFAQPRRQGTFHR
jgi:hypothetical protein